MRGYAFGTSTFIPMRTRAALTNTPVSGLDVLVAPQAPVPATPVAADGEKSHFKNSYIRVDILAVCWSIAFQPVLTQHQEGKK